MDIKDLSLLETILLENAVKILQITLQGQHTARFEALKAKIDKTLYTYLSTEKPQHIKDELHGIGITLKNTFPGIQERCKVMEDMWDIIIEMDRLRSTDEDDEV